MGLLVTQTDGRTEGQTDRRNPGLGLCILHKMLQAASKVLNKTYMIYQVYRAVNLMSKKQRSKIYVYVEIHPILIKCQRKLICEIVLPGDQRVNQRIPYMDSKSPILDDSLALSLIIRSRKKGLYDFDGWMNTWGI